MQPTPAFTLLLLLLAVAAVCTPAPAPALGAREPRRYPRVFRLWADNYPSDGVNGVVQAVESTGVAIINREAGDPAEGVPTYLDPSPKGTLKIATNEYYGFLFPLPPGGNTGLYELRFSVGVPKVFGVLWTEFVETVSPACGKGCEAPVLQYEDSSSGGDGEDKLGQWLYAKEDDGQYVVRWWNGLGEWPKGHEKIYLRRYWVK